MSSAAAFKPLSYSNYLKHSFKVASKHYSTLFGYALLLGLYYFSVAALYFLFASNASHQLLTLLMGAWVVWLPLIAGYVYYQGNIMVNEPPGMLQSIAKGFECLGPLFALVIGLLILPSLILALMIGLYLFILHFMEIPLWLDIALGLICYLAIFMVLNQRVLSIPLLLLSESDSTNAIEHSIALVQARYGRTLFRSTLSFVLSLLVIFLPLILAAKVPEGFTTELLFIGVIALLFTLTLPFFWSLILVDLHDLEGLRSQRFAQPLKQVQPTPKGKIDEKDWF